MKEKLFRISHRFANSFHIMCRVILFHIVLDLVTFVSHEPPVTHVFTENESFLWETDLKNVFSVFIESKLFSERKQLQKKTIQNYVSFHQPHHHICISIQRQLQRLPHLGNSRVRGRAYVLSLCSSRSNIHTYANEEESNLNRKLFISVYQNK